MELVRTQLRERFGPGAETQGLRVYTTFDPELQAQAYEAVDRRSSTSRTARSGSLVAIDNDGRIRAMVGGTDFDANKVNLALGSRGWRVGPARGLHLQAVRPGRVRRAGLLDRVAFRCPADHAASPACSPSPGELWKPANYDKADQRRADRRGGHLEVVQHRVRRHRRHRGTRSGWSRWPTGSGVRGAARADYSLVLGSGEVSVLDMASAYSTFADAWPAHRALRDPAGRGLRRATCCSTSSTDVRRRAGDQRGGRRHGHLRARWASSPRARGPRAGLRVPAAGKTGTTTTPRTPGSPGTPASSPPRCGWATSSPQPMEPTRARRSPVARSRREIWRDFMRDGHRRTTSRASTPTTDAGDEVLNSGKTPSSQTTTTAAASGARRPPPSAERVHHDRADRHHGTGVDDHDGVPTTAAPTTVRRASPPTRRRPLRPLALRVDLSSEPRRVGEGRAARCAPVLDVAWRLGVGRRLRLGAGGRPGSALGQTR